MHDFTQSTSAVFVPKIRRKQVEAMRHIRPLLRIDGSVYSPIKGIDKIDPFKTSFLWNAEPEDLKYLFPFSDSIEILTFHTYAATVFFKPSLAEVYASIRRFVRDWSHVRWFCLETSNLDRLNVIGDVHFVRCRLFGEPREDV